MLKKIIALISFSLAIIGTAYANKQITKDISVEQNHLINLTAPQSDLKVSAWVNHQDNIYQFGETVTINLKTNQDAYITLLDIGTSGKVHIIFPNQYQTNNFIKAGQVIQVPSSQAPFQFKVSAPAGKEVIKVIATTQATALISDKQTVAAGPYKAVKKTAKALSKDLAVELKQRRQQGEKWAEYSKVITIVENNRFVIAGTQPTTTTPLFSLGGKYAPATLPLQITPTSHFPLHLRSDKSQYKIGDKIKLFVTAEQDCQLTILDIGTSGKVTVLLPNRYQTDNFIRAGHTLQIPSDIAKQHYRVKAPTGLEHIVAVCNIPRENLYPGQLDYQQNAYPYWGQLNSIKKDLELTLNTASKKQMAHQTIHMRIVE